VTPGNDQLCGLITTEVSPSRVSAKGFMMVGIVLIFPQRTFGSLKYPQKHDFLLGQPANHYRKDPH